VWGKERKEEETQKGTPVYSADAPAEVKQQLYKKTKGVERGDYAGTTIG